MKYDKEVHGRCILLKGGDKFYQDLVECMGKLFLGRDKIKRNIKKLNNWSYINE